MEYFTRYTIVFQVFFCHYLGGREHGETPKPKHLLLQQGRWLSESRIARILRGPGQKLEFIPDVNYRFPSRDREAFESKARDTSLQMDMTVMFPSRDRGVFGMNDRYGLRLGRRASVSISQSRNFRLKQYAGSC